MGTQAEEVQVTDEVVERNTEVATFLSERQAEDQAADTSSNIGQILNGLRPHPDIAKKPEETTAAEKKPDSEAATATPDAKPADTASAAGDEKEKTEGEEKPKVDAKPAEEDQTTKADEEEAGKQPTKAQARRARREGAMRRSIESEIEAKYADKFGTLQEQIDSIKTNGKPAAATDKETTKPTETETVAAAERPAMPKISDFGDDMDKFYDAMDTYDGALAEWKGAAKPTATLPAKPAATKIETEPPPKNPLVATQEQKLTPLEESANNLAAVLEDNGATEVLDDLEELVKSNQVNFTEPLLRDLTELEDEEAIVKIATAIRDKPRLSVRLSRMAKSVRLSYFKKVLAPSQEDTDIDEDKAIQPLRSSPGGNAPELDPNKLSTAEYLQVRQDEEMREHGSNFYGR